MPDLTDDDLKFVLSVDPDEEALNRALEQINSEIDRAKVSKIKLELEKAWQPPADVLPVSFWQRKFGKAGEALEQEFQKVAATLADIQMGMDPDVLREQVKLERELLVARKESERAAQAERVRQAGGLLQYTREKMGAVPDTTRDRIAQERATAQVRKEMERSEHSERVRQAGGTGKYLIEQLKEAFTGGRGGLSAMLGGLMGGQGGGGMLGQLGGAAGGALGGPAGAMVGEMLAKALPEKIAGPARAAAAGMSVLQRGLQGVQGSLGPVGAGLDLVSEGLNSVIGKIKDIPLLGEVLGPALEALGQLPGVLKGILEAGVSMAAKLSPGAMKQFSVALEDAQATIGQAFLPVLQELIPRVREMGTIIAQALPSDEEMRDWFGGLFDSIRDLVQEVSPMIGPILKTLVGGVTVVTNVLSTLASAFNFVASTISRVIKVLTFGLVDLGQVFGVGGAGKSRTEASAARQANLGGIEEYQRRLQLETFQGGRDTGGMQSLPQSVDGIRTVLDRIGELFDQLMAPGFLVNQVAQGVMALVPGSGAADLAREQERGRDLDRRIAEMQQRKGLR